MSRPYGTWTHELGHAFSALGDTYASGAGKCKSGHPQSLMCWGAYGPRKDPDQFSTLWSDDVDGIKDNQLKYFGNDLVAPEWGESFDHTIPLDVTNPWPDSQMREIAYNDMEVIIDESLHEEVDPESAWRDF